MDFFFHNQWSGFRKIWWNLIRKCFCFALETLPVKATIIVICSKFIMFQWVASVESCKELNSFNIPTWSGLLLFMLPFVTYLSTTWFKAFWSRRSLMVKNTKKSKCNTTDYNADKVKQVKSAAHKRKQKMGEVLFSF